MSVTKSGSGPVVVLSHALALNSNMWSDVVIHLAKRYTVVTYDHRGHGAARATESAYSIEDLADDAAELIRSLGEGPVVFVGLSLGGMVGQALAARHGFLLRGLVLVNTAPHYADRRFWDDRIAAVRAGGMSAVAESSLARWLTPAFVETPTGEAVAAKLRAALLDTDPQGYIRACEAIADMDLRSSNRTITTPTLVVAGAHDLATPLAQSQSIGADVKGAQIIEVDAAHISAAERPSELANLIDKWICQLPAQH